MILTEGHKNQGKKTERYVTNKFMSAAYVINLESNNNHPVRNAGNGPKAEKAYK